MYCSNCGKQSEGTNFCPFCGTEMYHEEKTVNTPAEPRKRAKRRVWAIIGITAGVVAIAAAVLFFVLARPSLEGQWYNEDRGEVLVFNADGTMQSIHMSSVNDALYEYDKDKGIGTITLGTLSFRMQYADGKLDISNMGEFTRASGGFDRDSFIDEYGDSVLGLWFDPEGEYIYDLFNDGTCNIVSYGSEKKSTYSATETGITINVYSFDIVVPFDYTYKDGQLLLGGETISIMSRNYTEQKGADEIYDEIVGKYKAGNGNILEFFKDGTAVLNVLDIEFALSVKYDPTGAYGYLVVQDGQGFFENGQELQFLKQTGDFIMIGQLSFYKQ